MTLEKIKKRIETLLESDKRWPIIVDFSEKKDLEAFLYHFNVGTNKMLSAGSLCGKDGTMKFEELSNLIETNEGNIFLTRLSTYLKIYGELRLKNTIKSILSKSVKGHVIVVTYQCRNFLKYSDSRFYEKGQIIVDDGDFDDTPNICMISSELIDAFPKAYVGFEKLGDAYETCAEKEIYIATDIDKHMFKMSLVNIKRITCAYDILCSKDSRIKNVPENFGDAIYWGQMLKSFGSYDLSTVVDEQFGSMEKLENGLNHYPTYTDYKKWCFFIFLSILGARKDSYLSQVIANSTSYRDIPRSLFRSILSLDKDDEDFYRFYTERKEIVKHFSQYLNEVVEYCKVVSSKQEDYIYYLTDNTQPEKEKIIEWLDKYGEKYSSEELISILNIIYPDLAAYLSKYRFKNVLLDTYFERYKYQKVINKVFPDFKEIVEEQAHKFDFVTILKPRTVLFDKTELKEARTFFFDALGVEYLGFIQKKCEEYSLSANIVCGRAELPTLTCFNKDFIETCNDRGCPVSDIKELDEIKHHGENNYDYEKTKLPIYLIRELEIIDELLRKIQGSILSEKYEKAVIVSDHGASRLAVLNETENIWEMETKGVHSGRCCPQNEINSKPKFAIPESNFWVLANYDRFKGGRKANVEVHGGATIEEVAIPIIEITRKPENVEAFILDEYKKIILAAKEFPTMKVYAGIQSDSIAIKVSENYYDAVATEDRYVYEVSLPDCTKKGIYSAEIVNGSDVLSSNNQFEIVKKGMTEVNLFD